MNGFQIGGSWSQNINMPEKASNVASHGLLLCCGIFILLALKVASRVKSNGLKAMLWCRVVLWRNSEGWTCGAGAGVVGCCAGLWITCYSMGCG